jgi:phosphoribosyl-AMP cyclohydrolase
MMAWMNRESLRLTLETRTATYWSRSRKKLWLKGEESGNTQEVHQIYTDCDRDVILLKIVQKGEAACHTGHRSCFFRELVAEEDSIIDRGEPLFDPKNVYGKPK